MKAASHLMDLWIIIIIITIVVAIIIYLHCISTTIELK